MSSAAVFRAPACSGSALGIAFRPAPPPQSPGSRAGRGSLDRWVRSSTRDAELHALLMISSIGALRPPIVGTFMADRDAPHLGVRLRLAEQRGTAQDVGVWQGRESKFA